MEAPAGGGLWQVGGQELLCSSFETPMPPGLAHRKSCCFPAVHLGEVQALESRARGAGQHSWQAGPRDAH